MTVIIVKFNLISRVREPYIIVFFLLCVCVGCCLYRVGFEISSLEFTFEQIDREKNSATHTQKSIGRLRSEKNQNPHQTQNDWKKFETVNKLARQIASQFVRTLKCNWKK